MEEFLYTLVFLCVVLASYIKFSVVKSHLALLLISLIQIVIYYTKVLPVHYLQTDPLRRLEIWRLITTSLVHAETGVIFPDEHLWNNIIAQLWFGWRLEAKLGSGYTLLVYITGSIFGSLLLSVEKACSKYSIGASSAAYGLVGAQLSEYAVTGKWYPRNFTSISTKVVMCSAIVIEIAASVLQPFGLLPEYYNAFAHLGGAFGGFVVGVYIWNRKLQISTSQNRLNIAYITYVFAVVYIFVVGGLYCYFAYILSSGMALRTTFKNAVWRERSLEYVAFGGERPRYEWDHKCYSSCPYSFWFCEMYLSRYIEGN